MRTSRIAFALGALAVGLVAFTGSAHADAPAEPLARLLGRGGQPHPLANARGRIPMTVQLPDGVSAESLGLLPIAPGLGSVHLAPDEVAAFQAKLPGLRLLAAPPRQPLLNTSARKWVHANAYREQTGQDGTGVVVGVVDTGIDVFHPQFRNTDGSTRIAWLISTGAPRGVHTDLEEEYGCNVEGRGQCAIYSAGDINAILESAELPDDARDLVGHGTHVASIAAGNGGPVAYEEPRFIGVAPNATLIVAAPTDGTGFFDADLVNATRFIFDRADALGMPAVVNLSVGSDFGPHDGTSSLEKGLASMVGAQKPGHVIVVAAGNSGSLYVFSDGRGPAGIHTEARVHESAVTRVPLVAPGAAGGQGFVWITFRPDDDVSVGFEGPDGEEWIGLVDPGEEAGFEHEDGVTTAAVINNLVNGNSSITEDTNSAVIAWDGKWEQDSGFAVLLSGTGDAQMWAVGQKGLGSSGLFFERGMKQGTIAVPASDPNLLSVGCTVNKVQWRPLLGPPVRLETLGGQTDPRPDSSCFFSAAGPTPTGVPKPEIVAPGAFVVAAMGVDADPRETPGGMFDAPGCSAEGDFCYVVDDFHAISSGSSMSAPHVTGAVALLLQRDRQLTQARVTEILQAGARYPQGIVPLDYQIGPGSLDLVGALAVLEQEQNLGAPSAVASWWVLSSGYARPDPTWPVWGTVELRHADGAVAAGLSADDLHVDVVGGRLIQPLTKVTHGLFRFAVAGERGQAGRSMDITVRYGETIIQSTRTLPIALDAWSSTEHPDALGGGCSCRVADGSRSDPRWLSLGAALGLLAWARRRASARRRHPD